MGFIRVVATTPRKDPQPNISDLRDHSQSIFCPILTRVPKKKKKKKKKVATPIRVVATTPRKDPQPNISDLRDHSQSIFRPILTRIQKKKKKKKKLPPLYIDQLKCGIRPPRPPPLPPTPPRRFLGDHFMRERKEVET